VIQREKTLCKKNDSPKGDTVQQEDLRGREGPEQGGATAAPEKQTMQEALTRSYGQHRDDGSTRSLASRPKNVRIQGRSPTVCENGPVQRRATDTARNDAANENQPETCEM